MSEKSINQIVSIANSRGISLTVKREDQLHAEISGNKFRKLKYNVLEAKKQGLETLLTFGGAFSNHIAATAAAGKINNLKTVGVIRGDELAKDFQQTIQTNDTLRSAHENGMQFKFVSRASYQKKDEKRFLDEIKKEFGDFYLIPEGGTNTLAIKGCEEILTLADSDFDYICVGVGTGGTIAGLINAAKEHQKVLGFSALKGDFLTQEIEKYTSKSNWNLIAEYHFGGYGKIKPELITFINQFKDRTNSPIYPIYTGKMLYGITAMMQTNYFKENSKILAIHTGGLQGIKGMNERLRLKNQPLIV